MRPTPGRTVAKVVAGEKGPVYRSARPFIINGRPLLRDGQEYTTVKRFGQRFPQVLDEMAVVVDVNSPKADRWSVARKYWGMLPGWCPDCHRDVWSEVEAIRRAVGERRAIRTADVTA